MRLLILTQAVDERDPSLGFFVRWLRELAGNFESLVVVCLKEGEHKLPENVRVLSLGKEEGQSRGKYIFRLFRYAWSERGNYDAAFVHQNQEYALLAGWLWKLLGKRIFMWRNHYAGSLLTGVASLFCDKIFCTSTHSYTARYKKTVFMPVGVDLEKFHLSTARKPHSILFLGRMAPSKRPDMLVEALGILSARGASFTTSFYGPTLPKDEPYLVSLRRRISDLHLTDRVLFHGGVAHNAVPALYASHEIFVNLSGSGMYDKTLFEASASGCLIVSQSDDFAKEFDPNFTFESSAESLAKRLSKALELGGEERAALVRKLHSIAERNSLRTLCERLAAEITNESQVSFE